MGIPLVVAEPTGMYRRDLRRFTYGSIGSKTICPGRDQGLYPQGHDATVVLGFVTEAEAERVHGDNWPRDDSRWPSHCATCDYRFADEDEWQRNDNRLYRRPDGFEFAHWGSMKAVPPGTMWRVPWADKQHSVHHLQHVESWCAVLPDGGTWITSQDASGGGYWTVNGTPPAIDVSPSIWHSRPDGWHGWIRNGELVDA
jgi:Family of unknown function (DUF6527)